MVKFQRMRRDGVVTPLRDLLTMSLADLASIARAADRADVLNRGSVRKVLHRRRIFLPK